MSYAATPDGRVTVPHLEQAIDTVSAATYAAWLVQVAQATKAPEFKVRVLEDAANLRAVIRQAQILRLARAA